jgi:GNAT superfamily N-acetyltransferase
VINIRAAKLSDLDFVVESNRLLAAETENIQLDVETLRTGVLNVLEQREPGQYWIAEIDGKPSGQLMITFEWSDWRNRMVWWIQSVYVLPSARRDGVFRALYTFIRKEAQLAGAGGIRLYVDARNTRAQAVYAAMGMDGGHYRVFEDMF